MIIDSSAVIAILFDEPELVSAWRALVGGFVTVFFLPIFFTYTGLRTSIGGLDSVAGWLRQGHCWFHPSGVVWEWCAVRSVVAM